MTSRPPATPRTTSGNPAVAGSLLVGTIVACGLVGFAVGSLVGASTALLIVGLLVGPVAGILVVRRRYGHL